MSVLFLFLLPFVFFNSLSFIDSLIPIANRNESEIGDGFKYISEQVSHHPPVSACHSTGTVGWEYYTALEVKNAFKGKDMEVYPQGTSHVKFPNGDHITYKRATTCVRNIIVGKMWVDNVGLFLLSLLLFFLLASCLSSFFLSFFFFSFFGF